MKTPIPAGFAGGHVPQEMPESYNQGQGLALTKVELLPEDTAPYYMCLKRKAMPGKILQPKWLNIKEPKENIICIRKTYMGKSDWYGGYSYVDLLVPGVTEKFLEVTMKNGYEKTLKGEFGSSIKGIFSDEPNISTPGGLRWTPDLFDVFQQKWGI